MKTYRLNYILVLLLCCTAGVFAQTKKLSKTYKTNNEVTLSIDAKHTNVIIENWDRNEVAIEAYLNSGSKDKEEVKALLDNWKLETTGNPNRVSITSGGGMTWNANMDLSSLEGPLSKLPEIINPLMENLGPLLENIAQNPLPPEFHENMKELKFDYEAYQEEGDKYLERYEKNIDKKFGKDFEKAMEKWAEKFEEDSEKWEKNMESQMAGWEAKFEADMEKWGEDFGKSMEKWAESFEKQMEAEYGDEKNNVIIINEKGGASAKKTIKVKVPSNTSYKLNVRHGGVKFTGKASNLDASLSHSSLTADRVGGKKTVVKASYSPVRVKHWDYGVLDAAYVKTCNLDRVISIKLNSTSSDVVIKELVETGFLSGNFGKLEVQQLSPGFDNLDVNLENSDLILSLPNAAFNFSYNGTQSKIKYPKSLSLKSSKSYDNETLNGFNKSKGGNGNVSINASFSEVLVN
ncbi:hypothetical protein [Salegentibacter chungangensis]|uniref:Adhesin domain-containing protein n=1 Tax=Salegentibacter chungangensis TaxID=1335724 RepID=A0ABW3NS60_9FLAO